MMYEKHVARLLQYECPRAILPKLSETLPYKFRVSFLLNLWFRVRE